MRFLPAIAAFCVYVVAWSAIQRLVLLGALSFGRTAVPAIVLDRGLERGGLFGFTPFFPFQLPQRTNERWTPTMVSRPVVAFTLPGGRRVQARVLDATLRPWEPGQEVRVITHRAAPWLTLLDESPGWELMVQPVGPAPVVVLLVGIAVALWVVLR